MFKAFAMLAPFWGMFKQIMGIHRKGEAIKNRVVEEAHQIKTKDEFIPAIQRLFKDFYPDGSMDETLQEALDHPLVKQIQGMSLEEAQSEAVPLLFTTIKDNLPILQKFANKNPVNNGQ